MANLKKIEVYRARRIAALREWMAERKLESVLLYSRENTRFFAGFTGTESYALITAKDLYLYLDSRYIEQGKIQSSEYMIVPVTKAALTVVSEHLAEIKIKEVGLEADYLPWTMQLTLQRNNPSVKFVPLGSELAELRLIKDEWELAMLRKAIYISDEAWRQLLPTIKAGQTENQVAAQLEHNMRVLGASAPSFTTIIASGLRSALPHGVASDKVIEDGDSITMDFGALYEGYCSDITRTVFLGTPNPKILEIYNIVLKAQTAGEKFLRAGVKGKDVDAVARNIINDAGYGEYFGHGLGHSLGLEIHESPRCSKYCDTVLQAGSMMTVEPGIYIPGVGGVRIEDTCLVREHDCEVITAATKEVVLLH